MSVTGQYYGTTFSNSETDFARKSAFLSNHAGTPVQQLLKMGMNKRLMITLAVAMFGRQGFAQTATRLDTTKVDQAIGAKGTWIEAEGVYKVTFPRSDVKVSIDGRAMEPFMGLTSWAAFQSGKAAEAMVMGDLVLFQDEVNPAMSAALDNGLSVTALHNHFFFDDPKVFFMHIAGEGPTDRLAAAVRSAMDAAQGVRKSQPEPTKSFGVSTVPAASAITAQPLEEILGMKGQSKNGMFKVVLGRTVKMSCGCSVGKEMGVNTWAAFAGTDEQALVDGDFACLPGELQPTLKALRKSGINVVAIHNHMEDESPRVIFLHYWGIGRASELATSIKSALQAQQASGAEKKVP